MSFREGYAKKLGVSTFLGYWDAAANSPALSSGQGSANSYYIVSVSGSTSLDGESDWIEKDWVYFNGTNWVKLDNTDEVHLNSPAFTGEPTAPTPNSSDNSNKIATTAFVKSVASSSGFLDGGTPSSNFDSLTTVDGGGV